MVRTRRLIVCAALSVVMAVAWAGCRDREPLPSHYTDLGDGQRILVLMRASWHSVPYRKSDTAQWVAFRDPNEEPAPEVADSATAETRDVGDGDDQSEVEAEIRELIEEYNEIARQVDPDDPDLEELLEYHVESQREALTLAFGARTKIVARVAAVRNALIEKLPDEKERIEASLSLPGLDASAELAFSSIEVMNVETVQVQLSGGPGQTLLVRLIDDEWFFDVPQLENLPISEAMLESALTALDGLVDGLKSGAVPAEGVLQQFEGPLKAMLGSMLPQGEAPEESGEDEDDTEREPDDNETAVEDDAAGDGDEDENE